MIKLRHIDAKTGREITIHHKSNYESMVWQSADGRLTRVPQLSNTHIRNIIKCLNGEGLRPIPDDYLGKSKERWLTIMTNELTRRQPQS